MPISSKGLVAASARRCRVPARRRPCGPTSCRCSVISVRFFFGTLRRLGCPGVSTRRQEVAALDRAAAPSLDDGGNVAVGITRLPFRRKDSGGGVLKGERPAGAEGAGRRGEG